MGVVWVEPTPGPEFEVTGGGVVITCDEGTGLDSRTMGGVAVVLEADGAGVLTGGGVFEVDLATVL